MTVYLGERRDGDAVHKNPGTTNIGFARVELALEAGEHAYAVELPRHRARYPHSQILPDHLPEVVPFRYAELVAGGDGVKLSRFEQRALFYPTGLRARLSYDDGETWDMDTDQIVIEGFTPWGAEQGGGFGNTLELDDGTLVSCYSWNPGDNQYETGVVRWQLP